MAGEEEIDDRFHESPGDPEPAGNGKKDEPVPDRGRLPFPKQLNDKKEMDEEVGGLKYQVG
jgi:hypothetical protein